MVLEMLVGFRNVGGFGNVGGCGNVRGFRNVGGFGNARHELKPKPICISLSPCPGI